MIASFPVACVRPHVHGMDHSEDVVKGVPYFSLPRNVPVVTIFMNYETPPLSMPGIHRVMTMTTVHWTTAA